MSQEIDIKLPEGVESMLLFYESGSVGMVSKHYAEEEFVSENIVISSALLMKLREPEFVEELIAFFDRAHAKSVRSIQ